jgi:hypothetical protein
VVAVPAGADGALAEDAERTPDGGHQLSPAFFGPFSQTRFIAIAAGSESGSSTYGTSFAAARRTLSHMPSLTVLGGAGSAEQSHLVPLG